MKDRKRGSFENLNLADYMADADDEGLGKELATWELDRPADEYWADGEGVENFLNGVKGFVQYLLDGHYPEVIPPHVIVSGITEYEDENGERGLSLTHIPFPVPSVDHGFIEALTTKIVQGAAREFVAVVVGVSFLSESWIAKLDNLSPRQAQALMREYGGRVSALPAHLRADSVCCHTALPDGTSITHNYMLDDDRGIDERFVMEEHGEVSGGIPTALKRAFESITQH